MLWNWSTIDACFLSESWYIHNNGAFAASCIGVALLAVCLELIRRLGKEYDALLLRQFHARALEMASAGAKGRDDRPICCDNIRSGDLAATHPTIIFRASPPEQLIRAVLHLVFFGLAYILMLLAMYYNGYIIISIILGAGLGKFFCDWLVYRVDVPPPTLARGVEEPAVCCG
ncbi:copper transport protein ctr4 [Sodiomyces alkalinus F11]|uniref:Copper transport protein n=1 Tax=Sodiomyces alkalinus (strain CBS 110278 / VKM F-3762 / F11) TaxID=1314773 RepID=A0A3N2PPU2_SODAK|nr:copper transport protein ctr4 [Sodiomyces alkalinus F11]ROT36527.1 copper transport protein ctr4 [Sodiomyces alkalinus F11]